MNDHDPSRRDGEGERDGEEESASVPQNSEPSRSLAGDRGAQVERVQLAWIRTVLSVLAFLAIATRVGLGRGHVAVELAILAPASVFLLWAVTQRARAQYRATHFDEPRVIGAGLLVICALATSIGGFFCLVEAL